MGYEPLWTALIALYGKRNLANPKPSMAGQILLLRVAPHASYVIRVSVSLNNISLATTSVKLKENSEVERTSESLLEVLELLESHLLLIKIMVPTHPCSSSLVLTKENSSVKKLHRLRYSFTYMYLGYNQAPKRFLRKTN